MKNTIFVLAASLCAAMCAFGAGKAKKPLYTNGEEAVKAAVACEQPIRVFLTVSADGKKCLKGYYGDGGMPAILELEDLHIWLPTMLCSLDAGKIPYEVTPALRKFLETPQNEPKAKGRGKNKKK